MKENLLSFDSALKFKLAPSHGNASFGNSDAVVKLFNFINATMPEENS